MADTADTFLQSLMDIYDELGRQVAVEADTSSALQAVTIVAVRSIPGADAASITRQRVGSWETVATTNEAASQADQMQYELGHGPCVDAVVKDHVFHTDDLATDVRWPTFGPIAAETLGIRSVMSTRLTTDEDDLLLAGLNLYAHRPAAFDEHARQLATLLAVHTGIVLSKIAAEERAANLAKALDSRRDIGVAMGILMNTHHVTREQAFDMLRIASQRSHRKLRDIAFDVANSGKLELP